MASVQSTPCNADSTDKIQVLDTHLIDQIAAGEVVERPASVVKELLENAFDAGASQVQIDIEEGGLKRISIFDDGVGMSPTDLHRCWQRHATSKLRALKDFDALQTWGFRGEALSSIASIARLKIITRQRHDRAGRCLEIAGGRLENETSIGSPMGTQITVEDIFYNTPARRKFMRSALTEQTHVVKACMRVALGARRGGVVVTCGSRRLLDIADGADIKERAGAAFLGRVKELEVFSEEVAGLTISGCFAPVSQHRSDAKGIWLFVNGRYVQDRTLQRAVVQSYRQWLQPGHFPVVILYVDLSPQAVDVNVHPQKTQVRFRDASHVFEQVQGVLSRALKNGTWKIERQNKTVVSDDVVFSTPTIAHQPPAMQMLRPPVAEPIVEPWVITSVLYERYALLHWEKQWCWLDALKLQQSVLLLELEEMQHWPTHNQDIDERSEPLLLPDAFEVTVAWQQQIDRFGQDWERLGLDLQSVGPLRVAIRALPAPLAILGHGAAFMAALMKALQILIQQDANQDVLSNDTGWPIFLKVCKQHIKRYADAIFVEPDMVHKLLQQAAIKDQGLSELVALHVIKVISPALLQTYFVS